MFLEFYCRHTDHTSGENIFGTEVLYICNIFNANQLFYFLFKIYNITTSLEI
jgi:hypothetical protein